MDPVSFLAQGTRLAVWMAGPNQFAEWDLEANQQIQAWPAPVYMADCRVSPDGRLGIAVGWSGDVCGRNLLEHSNTNLPLDVVEGWGIAFSPAGDRVAVASALGFARVWRTGTWREEATLRGFLNGVHSVAFSPDGRRLATGGATPHDTVKLWDADSWQELLTLKGPGSQFYLTTFSPDGNALGTRSDDGFLHVWQAPSWAEINAAEAKESTLASR